MEVLLNVSECFGKQVLTSWLSLIEVCKLDTAFCNRSIRREFLRQLSTEPPVYTNCLTIPAMSAKSLLLTHWLKLRNIFVEFLLIDTSVSYSDYFRYGGHLVKKLCMVHDGIPKPDESVAELLNLCSNLEDIQFPIDHLLTHTEFQVLSKLIFLKKLDISNGSFLRATDAFSSGWLGLLDFTATECSLYDSGLLCVLERCPKLMRLNLRACEYLTEDSLLKIGALCPQLTHLYLQDTMVTDAAVLEVALHCAHLQELHIGDNTDITDNSIVPLTEQCRELSTLNVCHCDITDESLLSMARHSRRLRCLDVSECAEISDVGVAALVSGCPGLAEVCLDCSTGLVTEHSLRLLGERAVLSRRLAVEHWLGDHLSDDAADWEDDVWEEGGLTVVGGEWHSYEVNSDY